MTDTGLDELTAGVVRVLAAADAMSATHPHRRHRFRDPTWWALVATFFCLALLSVSYLRLTQIADDNHRIAAGNRRLLIQDTDCRTPGGTCFNRELRRSATVVSGAVSQVALVLCRLNHPHDPAGVRACLRAVVPKHH